MTEPKELKVVIVCDWLLGTGGAERVVLELHRMFPKAPIYTSQYDASPKNWYDGSWFKDADIRTSWLQILPKKIKKFLPPLRALYFSRLKLRKYDLVISSSGAEAKGIRVPKGTQHICYCHAPTHYYWNRYEEYMRAPGFGLLDPLARLGLKLLVGPMRRWDFKAAQRPDVLIANSSYTKKQIKKYYGREAGVIHPPVDVERFKLVGELRKRRGFVTAGRQTPYKRIDLPVAACTKLDVRLAVIGNGPEHKKLREISGPTVTFLTTVTDEQIPQDFQMARAFILPNADDFGIVAIEAMAAGTPVIAFQDGGALDYVIPGKTGEFFKWQTVESLVEALQKFDYRKYDPAAIQRYAQNFDAAHFRTKLQESIDQQL